MSTLIVPVDYPTIQSAVDAASPGDTIEVNPGTYIENIIVTKDNLTINATFDVILDGVDGTNLGMVVFGDNFTLTNFTIVNFFTGLLLEGNNAEVRFVYFMRNTGLGCQLDANDCLITECKFYENVVSGLDIGGNKNKIINNGFLKNVTTALSNSNNVLTNTLIDRNDIDGGTIGIMMSLASSTNNEITGNTITARTGIQLDCSYTTVKNNVLRKCKMTGILVNSDNNDINSNGVNSCANGIILSQDSNKVHLNTLGDCYGCGLTVLSNMNVMEKNIITGCKMGIQMVGVDNRMYCNMMYANHKDYMKITC